MLGGQSLGGTTTCSSVSAESALFWANQDCWSLYHSHTISYLHVLETEQTHSLLTEQK